jgi:hypothetical protein
MGVSSTLLGSDPFGPLLHWTPQAELYSEPRRIDFRTDRRSDAQPRRSTRRFGAADMGVAGNKPADAASNG